MVLCCSTVAVQIDGFQLHDGGSVGGPQIPWRIGGGGCNDVDPVHYPFLVVV
jgi:hypothetical protein